MKMFSSRGPGSVEKKIVDDTLGILFRACDSTIDKRAGYTAWRTLGCSGWKGYFFNWTALKIYIGSATKTIKPFSNFLTEIQQCRFSWRLKGPCGIVLQYSTCKFSVYGFRNCEIQEVFNKVSWTVFAFTRIVNWFNNFLGRSPQCEFFPGLMLSSIFF